MDYSKLNDIIKSSKNILIISHVNPDGDTLGSMCGVYSAILENYKKKCDMMAVSKVPEVYSYMPNLSKVRNIEEFDKVQVANYNCPGQIVISGETEQVKQAADKLKEAGAKRAVLLNVSGPFHSSLLTGAGEKLEAVLKELTIEKPQIPYVANVDASYITEQADIMPRLVSQVSHSVRWQQSVEKMVENGVDTFIEIGPGRTLAGFNKKIAKAIGKELTTYNVATMEDIDKVVEALK